MFFSMNIEVVASTCACIELRCRESFLLLLLYNPALILRVILRSNSCAYALRTSLNDNSMLH